VTGVLLVLALPVPPLLAAASLRLDGVVPTLLAAYVGLVAESTALTIALSPLHRVDRGGIALGEAILLAGATAVWWARGRPLPQLAPAGAAAREAVRDPATAVLLAAVAAALVYELVLVATVPPNNWDSLTYHLARAAAWARHGGVHWVADAPTDRMNEFQPVAEQQILAVFVLTGRGILFGLPQFVSQLAIVGAVYETARRLGSDVRTAACAALFFATFPLVALEATTAQNDLVAASLPVVAAALIVAGRPVESAVGGIAAALGLGVKLTTAFVVPVLVLLALRRGRRSRLAAAAGAACALMTLAIWGYVLNAAETGHVLGRGGGRLEQQASPSFPGSAATCFRIVYNLLLDLSGLDGRLLVVLAAGGVAAGVAVAVRLRRSGVPPPSTAVAVAAVALPLLAPRLVPDVAHGLHIAADAVSLPVADPSTTSGTFFWGIDYGANEDLSGFGPLGGAALALVSVVALARGRRREAWVLGLALPLFVVLLALTSKYNPWLTRFLIIPAALTAPLASSLFRRRGTALAIAAVATVTLAGTLARSQLKPLDSEQGRPWRLDERAALALTWQPASGRAYHDLQRRVPARACVGAALGADDPSYLLYGPRLSRRVVYLPRRRAVAAAEGHELSTVVIGHVPHVRAAFRTARWTLAPLGGGYWTLATRPPRAAGCTG
jgi:glycosyl transferase family 87